MEGKLTEVQEWDHIVPLKRGGPDIPQNLQGLCKVHHRAKTERERQGLI